MISNNQFILLKIKLQRIFRIANIEFSREWCKYSQFFVKRKMNFDENIFYVPRYDKYVYDKQSKKIDYVICEYRVFNGK